MAPKKTSASEFAECMVNASRSHYHPGRCLRAAGGTHRLYSIHRLPTFFVRPLPDPPPAWRRGHGRGVRGPRRDAEAPRRAQGRPPRVPARRQRQGALPPRGADPLRRSTIPNICRVYNYVESEGQAWLVLELIEGRNLRAALDDGLTPPQRLSIATQIAQVLVVTHAAGIVHRDLKPGNVMVTPAGDVKVLDFGLARSLPVGGSAAAADEEARLWCAGRRRRTAATADAGRRCRGDAPARARRLADRDGPAQPRDRARRAARDAGLHEPRAGARRAGHDGQRPLFLRPAAPGVVHRASGPSPRATTRRRCSSGREARRCPRRAASTPTSPGSSSA